LFAIVVKDGEDSSWAKDEMKKFRMVSIVTRMNNAIETVVV
jgi:hypothetical protein